MVLYWQGGWIAVDVVGRAVVYNRQGIVCLRAWVEELPDVPPDKRINCARFVWQEDGREHSAPPGGVLIGMYGYSRDEGLWHIFLDSELEPDEDGKPRRKKF